MTYDIKTLSGGTEEQKPPMNSLSQTAPQPTPMAGYRQALAQCLMPHDEGEGILQKQLSQLDSLFDQTLREFTDCPRLPTSDVQVKRLALAMRLQQSCTNTARSLRSMRYMAALEGKLAHDQTPPTPHHGDEQTNDGA